MASRANYNPQEKPLAQVLVEFRDELKDFAATRIAMLRAEMRDKIATVSAALPAILVGAVLAMLSALLLSVCLAALIAMALGGSAGAWAVGFAVIGFVFLVTGVLAIAFGINRLKVSDLKPERTLRVLKQDQIWFQNETRNGR